MDAFPLAIIHDFLLRKIWMILNLVDRWDDICVWEQLLQVRLAEVSNADGLDFSSFEQFLHFLPCLDI